MNIALDARWIFKQISGIGNYTRELMHRIPVLDPDNRYTFLFNDPEILERTLTETKICKLPNVDTRLVGYGVFAPRGQLALPGLLRRMKCDLYHSPNYMIPLLAFPKGRGRTACVVTIHDVIPMIFRDHAPRSKKSRLYPVFARIMREVGARADAVITVSKTSRRDIIEHLRIPHTDEAKVRVVYNGVSQMFRPADQPPSPRADDERTILYVGRADPYKNIATLIRALPRIRSMCPFPVRLLIAGAPDPRYPEGAEIARAEGVSDCVTWTGYLHDEELVRVYQKADVLVHPSRYEGFGLQIAEAMATDTPVVCSHAGALNEVAGDAALRFDYWNVSELAAHTAYVLNNHAAAREMIEVGRQRVGLFTWDRAAKETLAVYKDVLQEATGQDD